MFTYDPTKLSTSKLFEVRLNIGQTSEYSAVPISDEEIEYFLKQSYDSVNAASILALSSLIAQAGTLVDSETGEVSEARSQLIDNLMKLRDDLQNSLSRNIPSFAGLTGVFNDERDAINTDETIYQDGTNTFDKGIHDSMFPDSQSTPDIDYFNL